MSELIEVTFKVPALIEGYEYTGEVEELNEGIDLKFKPVVRKKAWRAKSNGTYYRVISNGEVELTQDSGYRGDQWLWELGNYFETEEQADIAADRFKQVLLEMRES